MKCQCHVTGHPDFPAEHGCEYNQDLDSIATWREAPSPLKESTCLHKVEICTAMVLSPVGLAEENQAVCLGYFPSENDAQGNVQIRHTNRSQSLHAAQHYRETWFPLR
jgi:hypothetical protein